MLSKESIIGLLSPIENLEDNAELSKGISYVQHGSVGKRRNDCYQTTNSPQQAHCVARQNSARFKKQALQDFPPYRTSSGSGESLSTLVPGDRSSQASESHPREDMMVSVMNWKIKSRHQA